MTLFLAGLVVSAAAILFALAPLRRVYGEEVLADPRPEGEVSPRTTELQRRKANLLDALRDLDFEFAAGKLVEDDYRPEREQLMAETAAVVEELDRSGEAAPVPKAAVGAGEQQPRGSVCPSCGVATRPEGHFCHACGARIVPETCHKCGHETEQLDRFCPGCGTGLVKEGD